MFAMVPLIAQVPWEWSIVTWVDATCMMLLHHSQGTESCWHTSLFYALYPGGRSKFISLNCCWNTILRNIPGREKSRPCILGKLIKTMLEWSGPLSTSVISSNDSLLILGYISTQSSCHSYSYFVFPLRKSSVYFTHLLYSNTTN